MKKLVMTAICLFSVVVHSMESPKTICVAENLEYPSNQIDLGRLLRYIEQDTSLPQDMRDIATSIIEGDLLGSYVFEAPSLKNLYHQMSALEGYFRNEPLSDDKLVRLTGLLNEIKTLRDEEDVTSLDVEDVVNLLEGSILFDSRTMVDGRGYQLGPEREWRLVKCLLFFVMGSSFVFLGVLFGSDPNFPPGSTVPFLTLALPVFIISADMFVRCQYHK